MINKLTYDEWKDANPVTVAPGVREDLMKFHGVDVDNEIESIRRGLYQDYLNQTIAE